MADVKKDHSVGAAGGAAAGVVGGAALGGAVGGPVGAAVGAVVGAVAGAKAGDNLAEVVNPTTYNDHWKTSYTARPYYNSQYVWDDYAPAYKLGYDSYGNKTYRGRNFESIESNLESDWNRIKGNSRLAWNDARQAVRDGWHHIERALPGDADGDGR